MAVVIILGSGRAITLNTVFFTDTHRSEDQFTSVKVVIPHCKNTLVQVKFALSIKTKSTHDAENCFFDGVFLYT